MENLKENLNSELFGLLKQLTAIALKQIQMLDDSDSQISLLKSCITGIIDIQDKMIDRLEESTERLNQSIPLLLDLAESVHTLNQQVNGI